MTRSLPQVRGPVLWDALTVLTLHYDAPHGPFGCALEALYQHMPVLLPCDTCMRKYTPWLQRQEPLTSAADARARLLDLVNASRQGSGLTPLRQLQARGSAQSLQRAARWARDKLVRDALSRAARACTTRGHDAAQYLIPIAVSCGMGLLLCIVHFATRGHVRTEL